MTDFISYANQGATRSRPLSPDLVKALGFLGDMGVTMEVFSGGQPGKGEGGARVGSTRHDHGNAADVFFKKDGRRLDWANPKDRPIFEDIVRRSRAAGVTGIGAGDGYMQPGSMHIGFGNEGVWGAGGKGDNAPDWLRTAFNSPSPAGASPTAFDPSQFGAIALDASVAALAPEQPAAPGQQAITSAMSGHPAPVSEPVAFDPVAAGAIPFDPVTEGAEPIDGPKHPEFDGSAIPGYNPEIGEVERTGVADRLGAFFTGALEGVPIVGPTLDKGVRGIAAATAAPFSDRDFGDIYSDMGSAVDAAQRDNPGTTLAGNVTGAVAPMLALGATSLGARALGVTGNSLLGRTAMSGASNALIGTADNAARGGTLADMMRSGAISGGIGLALPGVGAGVNALGRGVRDTVAPRINSLLRPTQEAERRVGTALNKDAANSAAPVLGQADEASAAINNQQLLNVDRGGETTRALARSAANSDPEARAIIERTASDRFASQGGRAQSFIDRITGGAADDVTVRESLLAASRRVNKPAYDAAFGAPDAQDLFTPGLRGLLASPAIRQAAKEAETRGANRAVTEGFSPIRNPFVFDDAGQATLKDAGTRPTLQFWDQVKKNLDSDIGIALRNGDKSLAGDLTALKKQLVSELDSAVPEYATARQGAAAFFGAEDALDAGKKFVTQNRTLSEAKAALDKMSKEERLTFAVGFASELKDAIKQSGDRTNVINKIFGSEQAREKVRMALGSKAFGEFEQFVKVESAMDSLRGAMGNSTTARQLAEMGLAGGAGIGTTALTGDWRQGITAAVLTGLARRGGAKIDERVTKRVAELLLSNDPNALKQAATLASNSPKAAAALDAIQGALSSAIKGIGMSGARPSRAEEVR